MTGRSYETARGKDLRAVSLFKRLTGEAQGAAAGWVEKGRRRFRTVSPGFGFAP